MYKRYAGIALSIFFTLISTLSGCTKQPDSTAQAIEAYQKVLRNEAEFIEVRQKKNLADGEIYENPFFLQEYIETTYEIDGVYVLRNGFDFCVVDLDSDQIPEVIINERPCYDKLILRYENGVVYACSFGDKQFGEIKTDGTAHWESGSYHYGVGRLRLSSQCFEHIIIAEYEQGACPESVEAYINGVSVSKEDFSAFYTTYEDKEEVVWYDLTDENIETVVK